jgi:hypothetical protein
MTRLTPPVELPERAARQDDAGLRAGATLLALAGTGRAAAPSDTHSA